MRLSELWSAFLASLQYVFTERSCFRLRNFRPPSNLALIVGMGIRSGSQIVTMNAPQE